MTRLSVNLNAIAMLRNRRDLPWPSVTGLGRIALENGAHGLTVHPRPDERHIRYSDVPKLRALIDDEFAGLEFNIEGFPTESFLKLVEANEPEQVTLVPDEPGQSTSDHGWDFIAHRAFLTDTVARLRERGFRVSLFCEPDADEKQIAAAVDTGANRIELYTGPYGAMHEDAAGAEREVAKLAATAKLAAAAGLGVNAGHDLTVANLALLLDRAGNIAEVSIGHAMTADALELGMAAAVKRFLQVLNR